MYNILHKILYAFGTGLIAIGSLFSPITTQNLGATIPVNVAVFTTSLATSISTTDTSMTLVNGTNKAGNAISGYTCFNIDEGTSLEEFTCGTASSTAITSMIRGIDPVDGKTQVSILKKSHRRGASVKITDYPAIAIVSRILNGDETFPNIIKYDIQPTFTASTSIVSKGYVDGVAIAGGADASVSVKGISKLSTAPASSTNPISVGDNDTRVPPINTSSMTSGQVSALLGNNTDIAVGSGNKYVTQTGLQHNSEKFAVSSTSTDNYEITLSPVPTSYTTGMVVYFQASSTNVGTSTLNVNGLGAKTIVKGLNTILADGDIVLGQFVTVIYDGTNFVLQNPTQNVQVNGNSYTSGISNRSATGTQTITHNLGVIPKRIIINSVGVYSGGSGSNINYWEAAISNGIWDASGNSCVYLGSSYGGTYDVYNDNTYSIISRHGMYTGATDMNGYITNVTPTTFDIVWSGTQAGLVLFNWGVQN